MIIFLHMLLCNLSFCLDHLLHLARRFFPLMSILLIQVSGLGIELVLGMV